MEAVQEVEVDVLVFGGEACAEGCCGAGFSFVLPFLMAFDREVYRFESGRSPRWCLCRGDRGSS